MKFLKSCFLTTIVSITAGILFAAEEPTKKRERPEDTEQELIEPAAKRPKIEKVITVVFSDGSEKTISEDEKNLLLASNVIKNQIESFQEEVPILLNISESDFKQFMPYLNLLQKDQKQLLAKIKKQKTPSLSALLRIVDFLDIPLLYDAIIQDMSKKILSSRAAKQIEEFRTNTASYLQQFESLAEPVKQTIAQTICQKHAQLLVNSLENYELQKIKHPGGPYHLSNDLKTMVYFRKDVIIFYNLETKTEIRNVYRGLPKAYFSPDDQYFCALGSNNCIIFSPQTGAIISTIANLPSLSAKFTVDPTSHFLICAQNGIIQYYDLKTGIQAKELTYQVFSHKLNAITINRSGSVIALIDDKGMLQLLSSQTGEQLNSINLEPKLTKDRYWNWSLTFNEEDSLIAIYAPREIMLLDAQTLETKKNIPQSLKDCAFFGDSLLTNSANNGVMLHHLNPYYSIIIFSDRKPFKVSKNKKQIAQFGVYCIIYDLEPLMQEWEAINNYSFEQALFINAIAWYKEHDAQLVISTSNEKLREIYNSFPDAIKTLLEPHLTFEYVFVEETPEEITELEYVPTTGTAIQFIEEKPENN